MKSKALGNIGVAQELLNKNTGCCANASVHCSYYAVFQYMKFMLANTNNNPIPYDMQERNAQGKGSHEYVLHEIKCRIKDHRKARSFELRVRDLKNFRVRADYGEIVLQQEEGLCCKQNADECISKLKQFFGNI